MTEFREKALSIATPRKTGETERRVEKAEGTTVIHDVHWDGRQDAIVRPDVVRYGAKIHNTGKKKGQTAEVREMTPKERRERHGESR